MTPKPMYFVGVGHVQQPTYNITIEVTYRITAHNNETGEMMEWSAVGEEEREQVERFLHDCRTVRGNYSVEQW